MGSTKSGLYHYVEWLREQFQVDFSSYPINTIELCGKIDSLNLQYHDFRTDGFCGAILLGSKSDTMILNSQRSFEEQNFDCGHETVHMTKHRNKGIDSFSCMELKVKRDPSVSFYEWEANEGSAEFLVPYHELLPRLKNEMSHLKEWNDIRFFKFQQAEHFKVSEAVINFRFESLKYETYQYLNGASINSLKILSRSQQEAKKIQVQSLNDFEDKLFQKELKQWRINIQK